MALNKIKTEMNGTGGGRWCLRVEAKNTSKRLRREKDKREVKERLNESHDSK